MQVNVEKLPKSEVKILVEFEASEMKAFEEKAAKEISEQVKIDGFRAGKAPVDMIKKQVGDTAFESHVVDVALPVAFSKAIEQENLHPVSRPKLNITSQSPLKFEATIAVMPEITLKDYSKIEVKSKKVEVTDKDVKDIVESLQRREATFKDVDRAAKKGDRVELDFQGYDKDGKELPNTGSKNHPVVIGDGMLIPGFEDGVVGMKKDEEKELNLTFPKDYHAEQFKGKKVKFTVKLNRVEERELMEINDEFAAKVSGGHAKSLEQLNKDIKTNLVEVRGEEEKKRREEAFLEEFIKFVEVELPEAMIEDEIDFMLDRTRESMKARGGDFEKFMEAQKAAGKDVRKEMRANAEKQVKLRLGLREVYNKEKIEVKPEDLKAEIAKVSKGYPPQYADAIAEMYKEGTENYRILQNQVRLNKVFEKYLK